jgi:Pyridoxal-phosphate dependent enzyme
VLKEHFPRLRTYAVEPEKSPVISGGAPSPHRLQGIGAGLVPHNLHLDTIDGVIPVSEEDAFAYAVRVAREEGIFVGPSSGAALAAVAHKLPEIPDGSVVLTFSYDTGERYFSVGGCSTPTVRRFAQRSERGRRIASVSAEESALSPRARSGRTSERPGPSASSITARRSAAPAVPPRGRESVATADVVSPEGIDSGRS